MSGAAYAKFTKFTIICRETSRNAFLVRKLGAKSRNLWSKLELGVVIMDSEGVKSCENAFKLRRKAIITNANETE